MATLFLLETVVDNTGLIIMAVIPLICLLVLYVAMRRAIRQNAEQLRSEFHEQLNLVLAKARLTEPLPAVQQVPTTAAADLPAPAPQAAPLAVATEPTEEITPEMLLVIAAAVTAYLGKAVRIRSARMLYSHESFNAWSQQGRAVIQASHNLAQRGY
jgi:methylmalonyl-CoA carboxyltransferase large subunit